jgi:hypothetical protein
MASALSHSTSQFIGMTDTQIFAFLVMPFLFTLSCSMVFFSDAMKKPREPVSPPEPVARPNSYMRPPRKNKSVVKQAGAAKEWPACGLDVSAPHTIGTNNDWLCVIRGTDITSPIDHRTPAD